MAVAQSLGDELVGDRRHARGYEPLEDQRVGVRAPLAVQVGDQPGEEKPGLDAEIGDHLRDALVGGDLPVN